MRALNMSWIDLIFLHWPVRAEEIRSLIPAKLELETFNGNAWVGVVPFRMTNVRTYVRYRGRAGIWFFSLDAESWLAVLAARASTNLPYFYARMKEERAGDEVTYESDRVHPGSPTAEFRAQYRPTGAVFVSDAGSFEFWSTERYCLFTATRGGDIQRLDVEHERWPLQPATADIKRNTMALAAGITLPATAPRAHFAARLDVVAHWPVSADSDAA
jgi:uncharacterized protein YqjF (DUF2071 family)